MGHYISIRGWIECPDSKLLEVKKIIFEYFEHIENEWGKFQKEKE